VLERLELGHNDAVLTIRTSRMTDRIGPDGRNIHDHHALVTIRLTGVTGLKLEGEAGSVIFELTINRVKADAPPDEWTTCAGPRAGDLEVCIDTSVGLFGSLFTKQLALELTPLSSTAA